MFISLCLNLIRDFIDHLTVHSFDALASHNSQGVVVIYWLMPICSVSAESPNFNMISFLREFFFLNNDIYAGQYTYEHV